MSEVAIDALRVDLTRLLLSARSCGPAKGRPETDQIAKTTSLFRRCKENSQGGAGNGASDAENRSVVVDALVDIAAATPATTTAVSRRSPLPNEGGSCCYTYTPLVDEPKPSAVAPTKAEPRSPVKGARPASPSHEDVDRRVYTYADGFKLRRRRRQPTAACFTFSGAGEFRSRKWHDRSASSRYVPSPNSPGTPLQQLAHNKSKDGAFSGGETSRAATVPITMTDGGEEGSPRVPVRVGEAWSENTVLEDEVPRGQGTFIVRSNATGPQPLEASVPPSRRNSSDLHDFLHREGRNREDRLKAKRQAGPRTNAPFADAGHPALSPAGYGTGIGVGRGRRAAGSPGYPGTSQSHYQMPVDVSNINNADRQREQMQAERDRELTFQPRLATTKYWAAVARRRRCRAACMPLKEDREQAEVGGTTMADVAGDQEKHARGGAAMSAMRNCGAQARFEMLYQDSKAKRLRAQEDRLKTPAVCTFQPRLSSRQSPTRRRGRQLARDTSAMGPEEPPGRANAGGDAYVLAGSAGCTSDRVGGLCENQHGGDNGGNDDDSQAWVNNLVFGGGDGSKQTSINSRNDACDDENDEDDDDEEERWEESRADEQELDHRSEGGNNRHRHRGNRRSCARLTHASEEEEDEGLHGDRGGVAAWGGETLEGRNDDRHRSLTGWSDPSDRHRGRSLSSPRKVTRRGLSEGAGQRRRAGAAAVSETLSYAERLYRGHDEQHRVWAKRRQESARLELKGCTFRPRLKKRAENRGGVGTACSGEGSDRATRRRSSSMVMFKTRTSSEGETQEKQPSSATAVAAAAHERLYLEAELARARRAEEAAEKERAETAGCTFQPAVNRVKASAATAAAVAPPSIRGRRRSMSPENKKARSSDARGSRSNSVFDRLLAAGKETEQRKAILGKMPPAGCTFRPQVNEYSRHRGPAGHANSSVSASNTAVRSPPTPQQPPSHPYLHLRGVAELDSPDPPPPPFSTNDVLCHHNIAHHAASCTKSGNEVLHHTDCIRSTDIHGDRGGSGGEDVLACSGSFGTSDKKRCADTDLRCLEGASASTAAVTAAAVSAMEVDDGGHNIPYRQSRFSPRRGRRKQEGDGHHGGDDTARDSPAHDRLFELGDRQQRKRNDSPRDTPKSQREREELEELRLCTFTPLMFTKAYRRPRAKASRKDKAPLPQKHDGENE